MTEIQTFALGPLTLQSGRVLEDATLRYCTYGELNPARDNVVVLPTFYTGTHERNEGFFGAGRAIDPARHFVVSINMFGNSVSTSPSNAAPSCRGPAFPGVTLHDNVACQYRLLRERFGVERVALVAGWSMAGCQAYQWGAQYPEAVRAIAPFCAAARVSVHNHVFLEGVKAALTADRTFAGGHYANPPVAGLSAFGRVYAGWAYSQAFFRDGLYRTLGCDRADDLLENWASDHVDNWDANDLLAMLWTWQHADISAGPAHRGDLDAALGAIEARAIVMPCSDDLYFPPQDNRLEVARMPNAELRVFTSPWGHCVASPGNEPAFARFLDKALAELLHD